MKRQSRLFALFVVMMLAPACQLTGAGEPAVIGPASPSVSTVTATPSEVKADGIATSTIRVQLKDHDGARLIQGGDFVDVGADKGIVSPVTDNMDGTYTATIRSDTQGTATIAVTINGGFKDGEPARVTFLP